MNALKDFHEKCFDCKKEIFIERDYYYKNNTNKKTLFICNTCREKNKSYKKYNLISEKKDKEDNFRNSIKDKFTYFIENNGKLPENEFYVNNLSQFQLFGKFVDYLCVIRELYSEENKKYKIFSQFINYSENLIDIANKNINIYDLYHFNEETIIYSYCNDKKTRFLSFDFKSNYEELLDNCTKNKYLSIQMLKYIYKKYEEMNLVNYLELDLMETKYFQIKEINIGKKIFLEASGLRGKYLEFKSILSELENDSKIINLKSSLIKLENELKLDKYNNSFLNIPGQFSILRKSTSIILEKIIKNNQEKLNFIPPSETILNSTLYFISNIEKQLDSFDEEKIVNSIKNKLKSLKNTLENYKICKFGKRQDREIKILNLPLINLKDEEKLFLAKNLKKDEEKKFRKISVSDSENQDLDFIINYLFELKDRTSKTIHVNEKETLKFYSFINNKDKLPSIDNNDDLDKALEKIKTIVKNFPKYEEISYEQLINFLFGTEKNSFLKMDDKIDYLLSFLDLKLSKLSDIKDNYKIIKGKLKGKINKIMNLIGIFTEDNDNTKYNKFLNIYQLKVNSKKIFNYLDNIINYIFCQMKVEKEENSDEESGDEILDICGIFKTKEESLRKEIIDIFEKDPEFINYIPNYLNTKLKNYITNNLKDLKDKLSMLKANIKGKNLLYLKLEKIKEIILSLKLYNFDVKSHFEEFAKEYEKILPEKKLNIGENKAKEVGIITFNYFKEKIKTYIGDINDKVEITGEKPSQFVLKLFLKTIGFTWL